MKSSAKKRTVFYIVAAAIVLAGIILIYKTRFKNETIRHIILISIDTCRSDHLSCYGYPQKTTPNIDKIAQEGVLFKNAVTPVPMTLPAHSSMLTGKTPIYHNVHLNSNPLGKQNLTLQEILKANGFVTSGIVSSFVLDSQFGLNQGFDYYNDKFEGDSTGVLGNERRGDETSRMAIKWLKEHQNENFFLFLHYWDPHFDYTPPEPFASKYSDNLYAGEIAYTDYCIGQVIKKLKELGLYDSSLIVITGDHGEMLGEHGEMTHQYFIYQSAMKVPLIFRLPGGQKAKVENSMVGLIDIVPTVCSILGIESPSGIEGIDLLPFFESKSSKKDDRYLYCESLTPLTYNANSLHGLIGNRWKYIETTRSELYDLPNDPGESTNVIEQELNRSRILEADLKEMMQEALHATETATEGGVTLDEVTRKKLESLGYVAGGTTENIVFDKTKADPKDRVNLHSKNLKAKKLFIEKKYDQAQKILQEIRTQYPDYYELHYLMGKIAMIKGQKEKAVSYFYDSLKSMMNKHENENNLARALLEIDRPEEAIKHFNESLRLEPNQPQILGLLSTTYFDLGKIEKAIDTVEKALQFNPNNPQFLNTLAWILATSEDVEYRDAERAIRLAYQACQLTKFQDPIFLDTLATAYASAGRFGQAVEIATRALALAEKLNLPTTNEIKGRLNLYKSGKAYYEHPDKK